MASGIIGQAFLRIRPDMSGFAGETRRGVAGPLAAIASIAGGIKFFGSAMKEASSLQEALQKVRVVFGQGAEGIIKWSQGSATAMGISNARALEAVGTYGNLFTSFGMSKEKAGEFSTTMVQLAADLASFNNVPIEEALTAIRAGLTGETEPMKRFGVALDDMSLKQKAMAMGLRDTTVGVLPPHIKIQAAYAMMLERSKNAQGDFARTSHQYANQLKIMAARWKDVKVAIGTPLIKAAVALFGVFDRNVSPAVKNIANQLKNLWNVIKSGDDVAQGAAEIIDNIFGNSGKLVRPIREVIEVFQWMWKAIEPAVMPILRFFRDAVKENPKPVFIALAAAIGLMVAPLLASAAASIAAVAGPLLLAAAIGALVSVFIKLYKENEGFRKFVDGVGTKIKDFVLPIVNKLREGVFMLMGAFNGEVGLPSGGFIGFMVNVGKYARIAWEGIKAFIYTLTTGFTEDEGTPIEKVALALRKVATFVIQEVIPALATLYKEYLSKLFTALFAIGNFIFEKVIPALVWLAKELWERLNPALQSTGNFLMTYIWPALRSVAEFIGRNFVPAMQGIWNVIKIVAAALMDFGRYLVDTFGPVISAIGNLVSAIWERIRKTTATVWPYISAVVRFAWDVIFAIVKAAFVILWPIIKTGLNVIWEIFKAVWNVIRDVVRGVMHAIAGIINAIAAIIRGDVGGFLNGLLQAFKGIFEAIYGAVKGILGGLVGVIRELVGGIPGIVMGILRGLVGLVADLGRALWDAGAKIIQALIDGIKSKIGGAVDAVKGGMKSIRDLLPFSPAKKGPFSGKGWSLYSGQSISKDLARGIRDQIGAVKKASTLLAVAAQPTISPLALAFGSGAFPPGGPGAGAMAVGSGPNVQIDVHPSPGMDERLVGRTAAQVAGYELRTVSG